MAAAIASCGDRYAKRPFIGSAYYQRKVEGVETEFVAAATFASSAGNSLAAVENRAPPLIVPPSDATDDAVQVPLDRPLESTPQSRPEMSIVMGALSAVLAPLGFTGRSSVRPREIEEDPHFIVLEDRWRSGFPAWDRYDKNHPANDDYPFVEGHIWDPYNQNVLKGDYPDHRPKHLPGSYRFVAHTFGAARSAGRHDAL